MACAPREINMEYLERRVPFHRRIDGLSAHFIGVPYVLNPLGEGFGFDPDPILRNDAFDCVTFVETVMAKARSGSIVENKIAISYIDGNLDWASRRHFFEVDHYAGTMVLVRDMMTHAHVGTIDRCEFLRRQNPDVICDVPPHEFMLPYVPGYEIGRIRLPRNDAFVVGVVWDNPRLRATIGSDVLISHVGLLIVRDGVAVVRHASSAAGMVVEESWEEFTMRQMALPHRIGITLWRPVP